MRRAFVAHVCCLGWLLIASAGYGQTQDREQFEKEEKAWQASFSLIDYPLLLDTKGLKPPFQEQSHVPAPRGEPLPLPPTHIGMWVQSVGRRVVAIPGGYILRNTTANAEFGSTLKQFGILQWLSSLDASQAESLTNGAPFHTLDARGRAVLSKASESFPGGYAALADPESRITTQLAASIVLEVPLGNGSSSRMELSSHVRPEETQAKNQLPPSPLPPYMPPPLNPKSVPLKFGDGQLTSIYHLAQRLYEDARILLQYDSRHTFDPIFIKGTWDSCALIEAINRYHETEPVVPVEYEDQYSVFAGAFESSFAKIANTADDDFRKLADLAESGQTLTWAQLERDFPKIVEGWEFLDGYTPSPQSQVMLERSVGMKIFGRDRDDRYMGGAFYTQARKPSLPTRSGS